MNNRKKDKIIFMFNLFGYTIKKNHRPFIRFLGDYYQGTKGEGLLTGVEIGVQYGKNAKNILDNLPVKKLYLIDPYLKNGNNGIDEHTKVDTINRLVKHKSKITWIFKKSSNAHCEIREKVDFIYIDGNHEYSFVKEDMENYYPLLKRGGILCGHDVGHKGVSVALQEFVRENDLLFRIIYPDWIIFKNDVK